MGTNGLNKMVALTAIFGGPPGYFGPVASLLDAPLFTLWFLSVLVLAVRVFPLAEYELPFRRRLVRSAAVAVGGLLLAAPVLWRRIAIHDEWFGAAKDNPNRAMTVFFQAL